MNKQRIRYVMATVKAEGGLSAVIEFQDKGGDALVMGLPVRVNAIVNGQPFIVGCAQTLSVSQLAKVRQLISQGEWVKIDMQGVSPAFSRELREKAKATQKALQKTQTAKKGRKNNV